MDSAIHPEARPSAPGLWRRPAWLAIPLLVVAMAALWVAGLRTAWPFPPLYWLTNYGVAILALGFIVLPAARGFVADGQPSVLMLGCGMLMTQIGMIAGAIGFTRDMNTGFTIYNTSILLSALCQFAGVAVTYRPLLRLGRPASWLAAAYAGCLTVMGLVIWAAFAGRMPVFFIAGQGETLLRSLVLAAAVALFLLTAGLLWVTNRRAPSPFFHWYALGLALLAAGLAGTMAVTVRDSPLQWASRITQALGTVYMCVAVWTVERARGAQAIPMEAMADTWREPAFLAVFNRHTVIGWTLRYVLGAAVALAAFGLRQALTARFGPGLPPYITLYPAVMTVAFMAGLGPGLLAMAVAVALADYWILPPIGQLAIASPMDRLGLVFFIGMSLFICAAAALHRRHRDKAAAYDRERLLRASETRYRLLFEMITEGFSLNEILFDDADRPYDLRYLAVNPAFERHTGLKAADILGRTTLELFPQAEPLWFEFYGKVVRTGEAASMEAWFGPLGRCFQVNAFRFEPGVCGVVFFDITDRKRAEEALRRNQEWLRVTLASIGDAVVACDTSGRVTFVNPVAASLTGWPAPEALGQPVAEVFHIINEQTREPAENIVARVLEEHRVVGLANHTALVARDGREIPIEDSAAPILDDQGAVAGVVLVFHDVSEAKQAERARFATIELLQEADRRKDEFLAVLSHELRNPLAAIGNSMHVLDHGVPGSEQARIAQAVIGRQVRQFNRLVDDLLDVTRISRNKIQLDRQRLDLVQLVRRAAEDLRGSLEGQGVRLELLAPEEPVWVCADAVRFT